MAVGRFCRRRAIKFQYRCLGCRPILISTVAQFGLSLWMADNSDEYEKQARECERMAQNSRSEVDRASWLRLAQEWQRLLRGLRHNETPQVDQKNWPRSNDPGSGTEH